MWRARALVLIATTTAVLGGAVVVAAPAAAATTVSATPSTDLVDRQAITISAAGFVPLGQIGIGECESGATDLSHCDASTIQYATPDANGAAFGVTYTAHRVIETASAGVLDCAVAACVLAAANPFDLTTITTTPLGFRFSPLPPPDALTLLDPGFVGPAGAATARAVLTCGSTRTVRIAFTVVQPSAGASGTADYPCRAGTTVRVFSDDLANDLAPGAAAVFVSLVGTTYPTEVHGVVTLQSLAEARAALAIALVGPDGAQVAAQLFADLWFRVTYNPVFRGNFIIELLRALRAG